MGHIKCEPKGEMSTREWITAHLDELGFDLVRSGGAYPDITLADSKGNLIETEVEYKSANFISHKHDPQGCALVICWKHNSALPVRVLELSTGETYEPWEEPKTGETVARFESTQPSKAQILTALSGIPHLVDRFVQVMAEDLRLRSEYSKKMAKTRLPLLEVTGEIGSHLRAEGIDLGKIHPDDLLAIIGDMHTM